MCYSWIKKFVAIRKNSTSLNIRVIRVIRVIRG
jgi:hypothetical protein